ncbi:relaxase/mobilization protein [Xanthomonas arboricola pv. pruni MAFF 301427]|nr:relaxase/mobilization protein [Xanthomonas arboricola pv. pruni MAFF 301427]
MKPAAPAGYKVDQDGNVTYYDQQRRAMFTDTGPAVEFSQTERDTLETGLRLALAKFGPSIRLRGGDEAYRHAMADIAADKGLYVEFSDKGLQERYEQRREAIKAGRAYMAQTERAKPAQGGPGRTAEPEQERGQEPQHRPRDTGRSR